MKQEKKVLERIQIMKSYADSIRKYEKADRQLALELSYWIIQYGIYGDEPPEDSNPYLLGIRDQIRLPIQKGRNKGSNAKKDREKVEKSEKTEKIEKVETPKTDIIQRESYGNEEVNECLEIIRKYNNGLVDGTQKKQRYFGYHLVNKIKKMNGVKEGNYSWQGTLELILDTISKNKYYCGKIAGPESIYNNLSQLTQIVKTEFKKNQSQSITLTEV